MQFCRCLLYSLVSSSFSKSLSSSPSCVLYRVIYKSLWDFRPLRYSSRDGHAEGEHVNRGRDTPSFCPTLQVLDMSTLGDAADVNPVIKFLPHTCNVCGRTETWSVSPSVDMLLFGMTIPATVLKRSEIPEGLMNYPVVSAWPTLRVTNVYHNLVSAYSDKRQ